MMNRKILAMAGVSAMMIGLVACGSKAESNIAESATPAPTAEATPTPEVPEATPTPAVEMSQTASGVNIIKQSGTYYAVEGVNVRSDCSTDADIITGTLVGQQLTSTGVSEDGQWVEVSINDQTGYVNAQYVSTEAPAGAATADAAAQTTAQ